MSGLYINKFVDRLQQLESKGQREFICPIQDAKNLHNDITKLLLIVEELRNNAPTSNNSEVIQIDLEGGGF